MEVHNAAAEPWRVTLVDTGEKAKIGGRIKRILPYLGDGTCPRPFQRSSTAHIRMFHRWR